MADNLEADKIIPQSGAETQPESFGAETGPMPEKETAAEKELEQQREAAPVPETAGTPRRQPLPRPTALPIPAAAKDELAVKIEKVMEEGINDAYQRLSPVAKQEFKLKGEQAAGKIRELLRAAHVKTKKILRLILEWLKMLPGINHFFLEQEAKIKTDKIIALTRKDNL